jgi:hypothetical protein
MDGIIIIDDKQYPLQGVAFVTLSHSENGFEFRTSSLPTVAQPSTDDEDILNNLLAGEGEGNNVTSEVEVERVFNESAEELPVPQRPSLTEPPTPIQKVHSAFNPTPPVESSAPKGRVRLSEEPVKSGHRPAFGAQSPPSHPPQRPVVDTNAPSKNGILIPDVSSTLVGERFPLQVEHIHILNSIRKDLLEEGGIVYGGEGDKLKCLKSNVPVKSEPFGDMGEKSLRGALLSLVMSEQAVTRADDRENKLRVDMKPVLCVDSVIDETAGTGVFHYEEIVSVFENPKTYRTVVDNGKD